jgi:hypothetical protein
MTIESPVSSGLGQVAGTRVKDHLTLFWRMLQTASVICLRGSFARVPTTDAARLSST